MLVLSGKAASLLRFGAARLQPSEGLIEILEFKHCGLLTDSFSIL